MALLHRHMISFAEKVVAYTNGLDQQPFVASGLVADATLRNLELIGEAAISTTTLCGASSCRMFRP